VVGVDGVGAVGDEFSPQVTVATVAMTTVMKRPRLDFTFRASPDDHVDEDGDPTAIPSGRIIA